MRWEIINKLQTEDIVKILLKNRGLKTKKQVEEFFSPPDPLKMKPEEFGLKKEELLKAVRRINQAINKGEDIIIYGDYDTDGICGTAILWETIYNLTKKALPYIPERVSEGYGLNKESIRKLKERYSNLGLIVTVDHGITGSKKINFAKELGIDIVVCDHHQPGEKIPECSALVHTDKICAAAIAWLVAKQLEGRKFKTQNDLDLVAIATIADLEPLMGINRSLVKYGLKALNTTKRCGLLAIFEEAGIKQGKIGPYEIGFIIAPRLNAMGRVEHALNSLRLVCTSKPDQARQLALKLGETNRERQALTDQTVTHARELISGLLAENKLGKLIFLTHESYQEGVIGLAAGKLVEEFYRPAIVVSKKEVFSKASARSINGFNIIEAIRACSDLLIDAGGHPMAAGFTIETSKLELLKSRLEQLAEKELDKQKLTKTLKIDCELKLEDLSLELYGKISQFEPFGIGNPEPVFISQGVRVIEGERVGEEGKHLKLKLSLSKSPVSYYSQSAITYEAIGFGLGHLLPQLSLNQQIDIAYNLILNEWNGTKKIQLKLRDIKWKKDSKN